MNGSVNDIERRFGDAMFEVYRDARDIGYTPSIFLRMLHEKGALQTALQLVNTFQPSDGYTRLWELRRLDLSVEAIVHDNAEWHDLFTQDELLRCEKRLADYGYFQSAKDEDSIQRRASEASVRPATLKPNLNSEIGHKRNAFRKTL